VKLFQCPSCRQTLFFENVKCEKCGRALGYLPDRNVLTSLEPADDLWSSVADDRSYRFCGNAAYQCCNWLIPAERAETFCLACRHNEIVPDLSFAQNVALWRKVEAAKHRLFYSLLRFGLPLETRSERREGLVFDFLGDVSSRGPKTMTGHDNGRITVALAEADDAERERRRSAMGEPYRTLLGHFRHEIAHYYWDRLVRDGPMLARCRALFGDDTQDYGAALQAHYDNGPPPDWPDNFVSAYAATHPWEDFAETWAHYLHIVDTAEMAASFAIELRAVPPIAGQRRVAIDLDPYDVGDVRPLTAAWASLTIAFNSVNRCMGLSDLYPFVLTAKIVEKLGFMHDLLRSGALGGSESGENMGRAVR
jgi:hypothetical protein